MVRLKLKVGAGGLWSSDHCLAGLLRDSMMWPDKMAALLWWAIKGFVVHVRDNTLLIGWLRLAHPGLV